MNIEEMTLEEIYDFEFEHPPLIGTKGKFFGVPEEGCAEREAEGATVGKSPVPEISAIASMIATGHTP